MASSPPTSGTEEEAKGQLAEVKCEACDVTFTIAIDRFKDPRYADWIKATLCLHLTKEGLHDFVTTMSKKYYSDVKDDIKAALVCNKCAKKGCNDCKGFIKKIESSCTLRQSKHTASLSQKRNTPTWTNISSLDDMKESNLNCHNNVAKLFMPGICCDYTEPEDGDCTALFGLISTCTIYEAKIDNIGLIHQLKRSRNEILHSGTMQIKRSDLQQIANRCTSLLKDRKCLENNSKCQEKLKEIEQIVDNKITIDLAKEESKAIRDQTTEMRKQMEECRSKLNSCTDDEFEEEKIKIKKIEEITTKAKVVREYYNLDYQEVDDAKAEASQLYIEAEQKKVQRVEGKFQKKVDVLTEKVKQKDTEISQTEKARTELEIKLQKQQARSADSEQQRIQEREEEKNKITQLQRQLHEKDQKLEQTEKDIEQERHDKELLNEQLKEKLHAKGENKKDDTSRSYEETISDLQHKLVDTYNKTYLCNPILIANPNFKGAKIDLFVKQAIEVVGADGMYNDDEVQTLHDVFFDKGNACRDIFVHGDQGVGKTVFCRRLAKHWCDAHSMSQATTMSEDTRDMLKFRLLFYIDASRLSPGHDLHSIDGLATTIQNQIGTNMNVQDILRKEPVLLIVDSVTDVQCMQARGNLPSNSVILKTGRTKKAAVDSTNYESGIDKLLQIHGLAEGMENQLADKIVRCLDNKTWTVKARKDFILQMEQIGLKQYLRIPMVLVQLILLWNSDNAPCKSQSELYKQMIHRQLIEEHNRHSEHSFKSSSTFPLGCKETNCPCKHYGVILWKIANLAFDMLYSKQIMHGLSTDELDFCLNAGILTEDSTRYGTSVNFLHSTNQEFFASTHLFNSANKTELLRKTLAKPELNLNDVLEIDHVLQFRQEQDITVAQDFTKLLMEKVDGDDRVQLYRSSCERRWNAPFAGLINNIQATVLAVGTGRSKLHLADVRVSSSNFQDLQYVNEEEIQSLFVSSPPDSTWHVFLDQCTELQKLVLNSCKANSKTIRDLVNRNEKTLRTLGLYGKGVEMISLEKSLGGILSLQTLVSIGLGDLLLTHEQIQLLFFENPTALQHLQEIQYRSLTCSGEDQSRHICCGTIDLSKKEELSKLSLWNLPALNNVIGNLANLQECSIKLPQESAQFAAILCLRNSRKLKVLQCTGLASSVIDMLFSTLRKCTGLRTLVLQGIDFSDGSEAHLGPSLNDLECVELYQFTMSNDGLASLVANLPNRRLQFMLYSGTVTGNGEALDGIRKSKTTSVTEDDVSVKSGDCAVKRFAFFTRD